MKPQFTREELKEQVQEKVETMMDELFKDLHQLTKIESGDIDPGQQQQLNELTVKITENKLELIELVTDKMWRNKLQDE